MPILGTLCGFKALSQIRDRGTRRGRGLARAGVALGLFGCVVWLVVVIPGAFWWNTSVRKPLQAGPRPQLLAGLAGDIEGFRSGFYPADAGTVAEAAEFLDTLGRRYGQLQSIQQGELVGTGDGPAGKRTTPIMINGRLVVPYELVFSDGAATAEAEFVVHDGGFVTQFAWIRVDDPEEGPIGYPPSQVQPAAAPADADIRDVP